MINLIGRRLARGKEHEMVDEMLDWRLIKFSTL